MDNDCNQSFGSFSSLFRSKARTKILLLIFLNPDREYYLRELERLLGIPVNNVRREILKLASDNIIVSRKIGNIILYKVNQKNRLFNELKKIVLYSVGVQALLIPLLKSNLVRIAFIYGSYAKVNMSPESDIDLFMVVDNQFGDRNYDYLNKDIQRIEEMIGREINLDLRSASEMKKEKKEAYIKDVLAGKKIFIKGGEDEIRLLVGS